MAKYAMSSANTSRALPSQALLLFVEGAGGAPSLRAVSLHVEVQADDRLRMSQRNGRSDQRAPVSSLHRVAPVAEDVVHEAVHELADRSRVHPRLARRLRERVAGKRGGDDVERISGLAAVALRASQHLDDLVELEERARPAMLDEERGGALVGRAFVNEVDSKAPLPEP